MAKDVVSFLHWCAEPELEEKKQLGAKALIVTGALALTFFYLKRHRWSYLKSMQIRYPNQNNKK